MSEAFVASRPGGTVAVVTGASRGVGRELVLALSSRGCAVVVVYLRDQAAAEAVVQEANDAGGTALMVRADFTDGLDVERLFDETSAAFGLVDMVVHTARGPARELIEQSVRRLRRGGIILSIPAVGAMGPVLAEEIEPLLCWLDAAER